MLAALPGNNSRTHRLYTLAFVIIVPEHKGMKHGLPTHSSVRNLLLEPFSYMPAFKIPPTHLTVGCWQLEKSEIKLELIACRSIC